MRSKAFTVMAACLLASSLGLAQAAGGGGGRGGQSQPRPAPETQAPDIAGVVADGTKVQLVKDGFIDADGIATMPDGAILFTERTQNKITKVDAAGNVSTFMEKAGAVNGIGFDSKGRLIAARYDATPNVAVLKPSVRVLTNKIDDHGYGQPKDVAIDKKGGVYFPDQLGVLADGAGPATYYVAPDGNKVIKVSTAVARPSGIALSPDDKYLYISDAVGTRIRIADVQPDGSVTNERAFVEMFDRMPARSIADGMTVDAAGRLYVATFRGVVVVSTDGKVLGTIPIPRQPFNVAFGGPDRKTLYVLAGSVGLRDGGFDSAFGEFIAPEQRDARALYKIPMLTQGNKGRSK